MNDDSHFLKSLSVELQSQGREYYFQRCQEIADAIERLLAEVAEWKQAAGVEADLRREFLARAEAAEVALSPPEPTEAQVGVLLERAMVRLAPAGIGSCTCETKNDDLAYHRGDCRARLIELAIRDLADARAALRAMPLQDHAVTQDKRHD